MIYNFENNFFDYEKDYRENLYKMNESNKNADLFDLYEGYKNGNMFKTIYKPYKGHIYNVNANTDKERLLLNICMREFALTDLGEYLDIFPNNVQMLDLFNKYSHELKQYKEMYEQKYGPLCFDGVEYKNYYDWVKSPWPWENKKGGM